MDGDLEYYNMIIEEAELDLEDLEEGCKSKCREEDEDLMDDSETEEDLDTFGESYY